MAIIFIPRQEERPAASASFPRALQLVPSPTMHVFIQVPTTPACHTRKHPFTLPQSTDPFFCKQTQGSFSSFLHNPRAWVVSFLFSHAKACAWLSLPQPISYMLMAWSSLTITLPQFHSRRTAPHHPRHLNAGHAPAAGPPAAVYSQQLPFA